jgi:hypothetical protein
MRTSITIGIQRKNGKSALLAGPEVNSNEQQEAAKKLGGKPNAEFSRIQIWTSDDLREFRFDSPEQAKARAESAKARAESAAKSEAEQQKPKVVPVQPTKK